MEQNLIRGRLGPLARPPFDPDRLIQTLEHRLDIRNSADDRGLAGDHRGAPDGLRRDQGRRQVSAADVFLEGLVDSLREVAGNRYLRHLRAPGRKKSLEEWENSPNTATKWPICRPPRPASMSASWARTAIA